MSEDPSNPPYRSYWLLTRQHPELTIDCECEHRFYDACGCISGACPWCGDTGKRPKDLGELLTMLEEAGYGSVTIGQAERVGGYHAFVPATSREHGGRAEVIVREGHFVTLVSDNVSCREEAVARLWLAVTGTAIRTIASFTIFSASGDFPPGTPVEVEEGESPDA